MKNLLVAGMLSLPLCTLAKGSNWSVGLAALPELTMYRESYPVGSAMKASVNMGVVATLHNDVAPRLSFPGGPGYVSRTFATEANLFEAALPRERRTGNAL